MHSLIHGWHWLHCLRAKFYEWSTQVSRMPLINTGCSFHFIRTTLNTYWQLTHLLGFWHCWGLWPNDTWCRVCENCSWDSLRAQAGGICDQSKCTVHWLEIVIQLIVNTDTQNEKHHIIFRSITERSWMGCLQPVASLQKSLGQFALQLTNLTRCV